MRHIHSNVIALLLVVGFIWSVTMLRSTATESPIELGSKTDSLIAVLNLKQIFKDDAQFVSQLAALKDEFTTVTEELDLSRRELVGRANNLAMLDRDNPDYAKIQSEIQEGKLAWTKNAEQQKALFRQRENSMLVEAHERVVAVSKKYAKENGIRLILQHVPEQLDPNGGKDAILQLITQPIVYQDQLDITEAILKRINAEQPQVDGA